MPKIFSQLQYNQNGHPQLQKHEYLNTLSAAALWFNLNFDTLLHLFAPGYQEPFYNGIPLVENSKPRDFIHNIYEYINVMGIKEHGLTLENPIKEKTKIYKLKISNYENRKNDFVPKMRA